MRDADDITIRLLLTDDGACAVLVTKGSGARDVAPHLAGLASELRSCGLRLAGVSVAAASRADDGALRVSPSETLADAARRLLESASAEGVRA